MFDEQKVCDTIQSALKKAFDTPEWKALFGRKAVKFTDDNYGERTSFPVIYIGVSNCTQDDRTVDSDKTEKYTQFYFEIEQYNQATTALTKVKLGRKINKQIVETIRETLNPWITQNSEVMSPDESIYRRLIEGYCTIDNQKDIFYR